MARIHLTNPPAPLPGFFVNKTLVTGGITKFIDTVIKKTRFGDYSSTAVDPSAPSCAVAARQYFGDDGNWRTYITRFGAC